MPVANLSITPGVLNLSFSNTVIVEKRNFLNILRMGNDEIIVEQIKDRTVEEVNTKNIEDLI